MLPDPRSLPLRSWLYRAAGLAVLVILASFNFGKLGSLYDYSIIINSSYVMQHGLVAHRDFSTPLLHLITLVARSFEFILGANYFALVWANLFLSFLFFVWALPNTRRLLPETLSIILVTTFVAATSLQHGIIWYNTIAAFLLFALTISTLNFVTTPGKLGRRDLISVLVFSLLLGMTKLNFFVVGVMIVGSFVLLKLLAADTPTRWSYVKLILLGYLPVGVFLGPLLDLLFSGFNYNAWVQDVISRPSSRGAILKSLVDEPERLHTFVFGIFHDFYPKSLASGLVAIFGGVYILLLTLPSWNLASFIRRLLVLALFFVATILMISSNYEISILTASLFLLGIVASRNVNRLEPHAAYDVGKKRIGDELLLMCCLYFFVIASIAIYNHSRMANEAWNEPLIVINPASDSTYLSGVRMTTNEYFRFAPISLFMQELKSRSALSPTQGSKPAIFFGPGLEYNYRVYDIEPPRSLPLWYQVNITWIATDVPSLLSAVEQCRFDYAVFISSPVVHPPEEMKAYFETKFARRATPKIAGVPDDLLTIWERIHPVHP